MSQFVVKLSPASQSLLAQVNLSSWKTLPASTQTICLKDLANTLSQFKTKHDHNAFLIESLRASLLTDLCSAFMVKPLPESPKPNKSVFKKLMFWFLTLGGMLYAICNAYDGLAAIAPILSLSLWGTRLAITAFIILSVVTFYLYDVNQVADSLEVKAYEVPKLLDVFVKQAYELNLLRKHIKKIKTNDIEVLSELSALVDLLKKRADELIDIKQVYTTQLNQPFLKMLKLFVSVGMGMLYFTSGFFTSDTFATSLFLFLGWSSSTILWPVLLCNIFIGLVALAQYWYIQRPGVDEAVAGFFGLDSKKIELLDLKKNDPVTGNVKSLKTKLGALQQTLDKNKKELSKTNDLSPPYTAPLFQKLKSESDTTSPASLIMLKPI